MTKKNFNWYYNTAHEAGRSSVKDDAQDHKLFVRDTAIMGAKAYRAALKERQQERLSFAKANPMLLDNIHS